MVSNLLLVQLIKLVQLIELIQISEIRPLKISLSGSRHQHGTVVDWDSTDCDITQIRDFQTLGRAFQTLSQAFSFPLKPQKLVRVFEKLG